MAAIELYRFGSILFIVCGFILLVHGATIRFNEPLVRNIEVPSRPFVNIFLPVPMTDVTATVTLTEDDGVSPLPNGATVNVLVSVQIDAILSTNRVQKTDVIEITADGVNSEYTIEPLSVGAGVSFKVFVTLLADVNSPTPITVVQVSTLEVRVYNGNGYFVNFLIVNPSAVNRKRDDDVIIYAIGPTTLIGIGIPFDITLEKDGDVLDGGSILLLETATQSVPSDQGMYWQIKQRRDRQLDNRFGEYKLNSVFLDDFTIAQPTAFVHPVSEHLDTNGITTITVHRSSQDSKTLERALNFGVRRTSFSSSIRWFKNGRRVNDGPRFTIRTVDGAGIYTLHRYTRKHRSWFIQIQIYLAVCLRDEVENGGNCIDFISCLCFNGGVCGSIVTPVCQCPPCFRGIYCEHQALTNDPFAIAESKDIKCGDLPKGNRRCKGYRFCLGGNYGCSCGCGWQGTTCDQACKDGYFGADCSQRCNCLDSACDRFTGECKSSGCPSGFHGFNCQVPSTVMFGDGTL